MLFIQYVYDINRQQFGNVADVVRAELPVYCQQYVPDNVPTLGPFESDCLLRPGGKPAYEIDARSMLSWLLQPRGKAPRVAYLTSAERVRWLNQVIWHDRLLAERAYGMLPRTVGQQYRTFAVSLFDPMGRTYERLLQRAGEHGFLQFFAERNRQVGSNPTRWNMYINLICFFKLTPYFDFDIYHKNKVHYIE